GRRVAATRPRHGEESGVPAVLEGAGICVVGVEGFGSGLGEVNCHPEGSFGGGSPATVVPHRTSDKRRKRCHHSDRCFPGFSSLHLFNTAADSKCRLAQPIHRRLSSGTQPILPAPNETGSRSSARFPRPISCARTCAGLVRIRIT